MTITGAFAGAGIQYVIPATLVWLARKKLAQLEGEVILVIIILFKLNLSNTLKKNNDDISDTGGTGFGEPVELPTEEHGLAASCPRLELPRHWSCHRKFYHQGGVGELWLIHLADF